MTTIAFDGKTIAADKASWCNEVYHLVDKLEHVTLHPDAIHSLGLESNDDSHVFSGTGFGAEIGLVTRFLRFGGGKPEIEEKNKTMGLLVSKKNGACYHIFSQMNTERILNFPVAAGSGNEIALGAMLAGADAVKAVEIVARRSAHSAGGVDSYTLQNKI